MRDVGIQLADYFDTAVERITVEDLAKDRQVVHQGRPPIPRRAQSLRPAWALAVTFATTIAVIGGSLGIGLMFRRELSEVGAAAAQPTAGTGNTSGPWILVVAAVVLATMVTGLLASRRRTKRLGDNGGVAMTTTLERSLETDDRIDKLMKTNRTLTLMAIVLAVLAVVFGSWAVYEATSGDDEATPPVATTVPAVNEATAVPADVSAVIDEWWAANNRQDGSVLATYELGGYHQYGTERFFNDDIAAHLYGPAVDHQWTTEPILVVDAAAEDDGRYVVVRGVRNFNAVFSATSAVTFEIVHQPSGEFLIAHTTWVFDNTG